MKEIVDVLATLRRPRAEQLTAQKVFLERRQEIWEDIQEGRFPVTYTSASNKKFVGAPRRTAIRCDFLLASKAALGPKYRKDRISDLAQRELLFYVLRDREVFPNRRGRSSIAAQRARQNCMSA
jgi:hypothetical protein